MHYVIRNIPVKFIISALLAVVAAAPSTYSKDAYTTEKPIITIVSQSDVRNLDGSSQWRYVFISLFPETKMRR